MSYPRIAVAAGHSWWMAPARARVRATLPAADVLVMQYECKPGSIGFDCDTSAQALFRWIIGAGVSWNARERHVTEYIAGSPTDYVLDLFKGGFPVPVTVSPSKFPLGVDIARTLQLLTETDPEESEEKFVAGIVSLMSLCERICVHSVTQWETIVVTSDAAKFIDELRATSAGVNASFDHVASESLLPQW